jgi:hypothetical protein
MDTRRIGRHVSMFALACASFLVAASCGSSGNVPSGGPDASTFDGYVGPGFGGDSSPAGNGCTPATCAGLGYTCGINADGCGNTIDCGTCTGADQCGVAGFSKCGNPLIAADGAVACTPKSCTDQGYDCGKANDGCGNVLDCGTTTCPGAEYCGGGGFNKCGGNFVTTVDGGATCTPATCASRGYNCGSAGDGCGGTIGPCGTCTAPLVCGAGKANVCGSNVPCTGLCLQQPACTGTATTTLKGTVRAGLQAGPTSWVPAGTTPDPVPGVLVYIPTTAVQPFDADPSHPQVQCQQCGADVSGTPLVSTTTNFDGTFTLSNVPVSKSTSDADKIPVVIQLGRWRRQFKITISNKCAANTTPDLDMPSTSAQGDIPLTAISTGSYDSIECVLLKMGVAQSEFTSYATWSAEAASGTAPKPGRVHIYTSGQAVQAFGVGPGATLAPQQDETVLMGTGATAGATNGTYMKYDQILLPCWGDPFAKSAAQLGNLIDYGNSGGRFFATHYSYSWLDGNGVLSGTAQWDPMANTNLNPFPEGVSFTGDVSVNVPTTDPGLFLKWLNKVGALNGSNPAGAPPANPTVTIAAGRHDVDKVLGASSDWIHGTDPNPSPTATSSNMLLHFTFDMPIGQASQCGHAIYSDFHVNNTQSNGVAFPKECDTGALTAQERILEYMIWDLASCVPGPPASSCTPKSCAAQGFDCGDAGDTCGNLIAGGCGMCPAGQTCGGGGKANTCGAPPGGACTPKTCQEQGLTCGAAGDGCGNLIAGGCGGCPPPMTCGAGGVSGQCAGTEGCIPSTCAQQNIACGPAGDGCGGQIASCGTCAFPDTCGGGGVAGQCGTEMTR